MELKLWTKSNLGAMNEMIQFEEKDHALQLLEVSN